VGEFVSVKLLPPLAVANAMKRGTQSLDLGSKLLARAFAIACVHQSAVKAESDHTIPTRNSHQESKNTTNQHVIVWPAAAYWQYCHRALWTQQTLSKEPERAGTCVLFMAVVP